MEPATSTADDDAAIGARLRAVRTLKRLSLKAVAERAGLSIGLVSQIERGLSSPSIRTLRSICQVVEVPMSDLFEADFNPTTEEQGVIVRPETRRRLDFGAKGLIKELITPSHSETLQLMEVIMQPGGGSGEDAYSHEGEEAGVVLRGEVELWVDETPYRLRQGDSFYFDSRKPHRFNNCHTSESRILWVATPPLY